MSSIGTHACCRLIVTLGAYPDVGKGVFVSSLGYLLQEAGFSVAPLKFDGYLNYSSGTMNPYHAPSASLYMNEEVFVLEDGYEADADSGYYERYFGRAFPRSSNISNGQLFARVQHSERQGQIRPGEVLNFRFLRSLLVRDILDRAAEVDFLLVEIGGTIGDPESLLMYEALSQLKEQHAAALRVILLSPYRSSETAEGFELSSRTKLTRQAFTRSWQLGLMPNYIVLRTGTSEVVLPNDLKYISEETGLQTTAVFYDPDCETIYELPSRLNRQGLDAVILESFGQPITAHRPTKRLDSYCTELAEARDSEQQTAIAIFGFTPSVDSYVSLIEAIEHAAVSLGHWTQLTWLDKETDVTEALLHADALILAEGVERIDARLSCLNYARTHKIPTLCLSSGFDLCIKEYLVNVLGRDSSLDTIEDNEEFAHPCGGMTVGAFEVRLHPDSLISDIMNNTNCHERFRCNSLTPARIAEALTGTQLYITGVNATTGEPVAIEARGHRFYMAVKYHPEYLSKPKQPHPLFVRLLQYASEST